MLQVDISLPTRRAHKLVADARHGVLNYDEIASERGSRLTKSSRGVTHRLIAHGTTVEGLEHMPLPTTSPPLARKSMPQADLTVGPPLTRCGST